MHQGARKITQRGPFQVVGKFLSVKTHDAVPWEPQNEEGCCYFLEIDPVIRAFCAVQSAPNLQVRREGRR
jgi:hypothetical protein